MVKSEPCCCGAVALGRGGILEVDGVAGGSMDSGLVEAGEVSAGGETTVSEVARLAGAIETEEGGAVAAGSVA